MEGPTNRGRRRRSLYVRQNKAYQLLLALLVVVFIIISAAVVNQTLLSPTGRWSDSLIIRMIFERRSGQ